MRWIKLWAALAGVALVVRLAIAAFVYGAPPPDGRFAARVALVPIVQALAAGWLLDRLRRRRNRA